MERPTTAWGHRNILDLDDFTPGEITSVLSTADTMREVLRRPVPKVPTLRGRTVVNLFLEPSTRTQSSFDRAAKALSADVLNLSASSTSVAKGESLIDTFRTLEALGADVVVLRHPQSGAPYLAAREVSAGVINGGDGWHAHPSQALVDIYTVQQHLGDVKGRRVVIVGDILHSRVARSNVWGFTALGATVVLCGPPTLLPIEVARAYEGRDVCVEEELDRAVEEADVVMALRLQRERQEQGLLTSVREYVRGYQVNDERLRRAKPEALLLHPGPVNQGIEVSAEASRGQRSLIEEQVRNGVAVRMALLYLLLRGEG
ncbi:MAG: aspartate carbamoyltransferase catalytic subunit [Chloroflexi bacterium]|nr:aspartate carbamoyltransferase catalytic subunit [Chloroflexota bacterium]